MKVASGYVYCKEHNFPLLNINSNQECVANYLSACLGSSPVVKVCQHGQIAYYVFENGNELPLLCGCCGGPVQLTDNEIEEIGGRRLERLEIVWQELSDGRVVEELALDFSARPDHPDGLQVRINFQSVIHMRHPETCQYHDTTPFLLYSAATSKRKRRK